MNCEKVIRQAKKYWLGELPVQAEKEFDEHLDNCETCQERLDEVVASEGLFDVNTQEQTQIYHWLRNTFTLDPERKRKGIEKIIADPKSCDFGYSLAYQRRNGMLWAALDESEMEELQARIGAEFETRNPIRFELNYTGELYFLSPHSAIFEIRKKGQPTAELDGKKIEFYLVEKMKTAETTDILSETIEGGTVVIDFAKLGLSIEDYSCVGFRFYINESTVIEGTFGSESSSVHHEYEQSGEPMDKK